MFSKTDKDYASAKHSVIRDMYVDPNELVFTLAQSLFKFLKKDFFISQIFSSKWRQNCRKQPQSGVKRPLVRSYDLFSCVTIGRVVKGSGSRHLIEYMKICEFWRSRSFIDLGPRSCTYKNSNWIFTETTVPIWNKFNMKAFRYREMKIWWHNAGLMTNMDATPIYGKNPS